VRLDEIPPPEGLPPRVKTLLHRLDTDDGVRHLWWVLWAVLVLALIVFIGRGGGRPADPTFDNGASSSADANTSDRLAGFGEAALRVQSNTFEHTWCAAVADTDATRQQGLMGRADMSGYDAMVFLYPSPTDEQFWMRNTPMPLTIGWFTGNGVLLGQKDMEPCPDRADCPKYAAPDRYTMAIEVPRGGFARLGIQSGAHVSVGGTCQ
jgi:uncharacterized membrane protein (UPF0127 family)